MEDSGLELLPDVFGSQLPRLRSLRLSQNRLTLLPRSFGELRKLQQLQVEGNMLKRLPDVTQLRPEMIFHDSYICIYMYTYTYIYIYDLLIVDICIIYKFIL